MDNIARKKGVDHEKLPDLPIVGNQRKWNVIKVVLRSICLTLSLIDVAELIAIQTASNALDYWPAVAYPVVSFTPRLHHSTLPIFSQYQPSSDFHPDISILMPTMAITIAVGVHIMGRDRVRRYHRTGEHREGRPSWRPCCRRACFVAR